LPLAHSLLLRQICAYASCDVEGHDGPGWQLTSDVGAALVTSKQQMSPGVGQSAASSHWTMLPEHVEASAPVNG
jgi:hypothetical protein